MLRCRVRRAGWRRHLALAATVTVLLGTTGCGARWSDDKREALRALEQGAAGREARSRGTVGTEDDLGGIAVGLPGDVGSSGEGSAGPSGASGASGGGGPQGPSGPRPCEAPSDAPGVSDDELTVGTINSISGPSPGLGASSFAAARAYVAYRNSVGGVCGRKIVLLDGDDGVDNARNRALVNDFESRTLALISGNACASDGGAEVIETKQYPVVGLACGTKMPSVSTFFSMSPRDLENVPIASNVWLHDQGIRKAAVVYVSAGAPIVEGKQKIGLLRAAGIEVVLDLAIPLTTLSYDSTARAVANSGADYLVFVHASGPSAAMAKALAGIDHNLRWAEYRVAYGSNFVDLAGPAAEDTITWITWLPREDGGANPEQARFMEWMERTAPDAFHDTFANNTWAAAKLLFDTLESLPGPISRDALLAALRATGRYDADGLIAPAEVGVQHDSGCMIAMVVEGGRWQRLTPAQGFLC